MEYQIVTLFIIAILNGVFSYFIIRGNRNSTNILFTFVTLSVSLWSLNLAFFIKTSDLDKALTYANAYYIFAALIPLLFFYFSLVFPNGNCRFKKRYFLFTIPLGIFILAIFLDKNFILQEIHHHNLGKDVILNKTSYMLYGLYFISFVLSSYYILLKRYGAVKDNLEKLKIKFVVWGTALSYLLGMFFNLFLPWAGNYGYIWLGPLFSLIMVASLGYATVKHHLFNEKVITTEILTFSLIFFILVRTLVSETLEEQIINSILLFVSLILGTLLIRSVIKEVETREKIEVLAEDLKKANEQLKKMDQQKSDFISMASHQLRGPVASLKGYSSMILEGSYGPISNKIKEVTTRLFQSSKSLALIIDDFLNLSRIERGKIEFSFAEGNVKEIVDQAIAELKQDAEDKKIQLSLKVGEGDYKANIDADKIKQIISNLIDNAIKYTPKGSVEVNLSRNKDNILLKISDSGIGIPKNSMDKLFKKFSRLENANDGNIKGTGLGLYLAKEVMSAHEGKVWAESEGEGKGSTFCIELKSL